MRQLATIGVLAIGLCLAGCSSSSAPATGNNGGGTSVAPTATIIGTFRIQGGPAPGINRPLDGKITIHANSQTGQVVGSVIASKGRFRTTIAPGRYVFVGMSSRVGGVGCTASATALGGQTVHVNVRCDVP
jgi:hypothetical protein